MVLTRGSEHAKKSGQILTYAANLPAFPKFSGLLWLVLRCLTMSGFVSLGMKFICFFLLIYYYLYLIYICITNHIGELSLIIPTWAGVMSISQCWCCSAGEWLMQLGLWLVFGA